MWAETTHMRTVGTVVVAVKLHIEFLWRVWFACGGISRGRTFCGTYIVCFSNVHIWNHHAVAAAKQNAWAAPASRMRGGVPSGLFWFGYRKGFQTWWFLLHAQTGRLLQFFPLVSGRERTPNLSSASGSRLSDTFSLLSFGT